ncbi:DUF362 domain-containing protein [Methanobacterium oryzae]|uniref:DUF362 domain-containing protein n=1 Tax=Methanobacterium oryzae TaxID=69540 RepID=UPI003D210902
MGNKSSKVFLIKTTRRNIGISKLMEKLSLNKFNNDEIAIKANFNSADPFPASTHIDTLEAIIKGLKDAGVGGITFAERSGMGNTRKVLETMGVLNLSNELDFNVIVLDDEPKENWVKIDGKNNHWLKGFYIHKLFLDTKRVIQTCCLKTHRFGGHFTLSLKNSVGLVAKRLPGGIYNYMAELHMSPNQRKMIAEINKHYNVDFVIMDAIKAFLNKGPETGKIAEPNLLLASNDRVAIDAVGVAILRNYGVETSIAKGPIFDLSQIKRAAELNIGVKSPDEIELVPLNDETEEGIKNIKKILYE